MGTSVALTILQFVITMLFFPIRVGAKGHASLARDRVELDLTLFKLLVARIRIKREKGIFNLYINGDKPETSGRLKLKKAVGVIKQCRIEGVRIKGNLLALIGTDNARNTAIMCALVNGVLEPLLESISVHSAKATDVLEIDGRISVRLSLLQLGALIAAGLKI